MLPVLALAGCQGLIGDPVANGGGIAAPAESGFVCADPPSVRAVEVPMRRITDAQYRNAIEEVFQGQVDASDLFPTSTGAGDTGFSREARVNEVGELGIEAILRAAEEVALQIPGALPGLAICDGVSDDACADDFIDTVATRAFRQPPTTEEQNQLRSVYDASLSDGATHEEALAIVVDVILQSPQFLYVPEIGVGSGDVRRLSGYEIASRLSFLLWDGIPDQALLAAAAEGRLDNPTAVGEEAARMLADPKAARLMSRFFREWLHVHVPTRNDRDTGRYPDFSNGVSAAITESFDRHVAGAAQDGWSLARLMTEPAIPVNDTMADYYGFDAPDGEWSSVQVDPERLPGLMTHPAVMASFASFGDPSYVERGLFVLRGLLCIDFGTPPANAIDTAREVREGLPTNPSARAISEATRDVETCGVCHESIDPPGLAFEQFDATGRFRTEDHHGNEITTADELAALALEFDGPRDLLVELATRDEVATCLSRQLFRYFAARLDTSSDGCALEQLGADSERSISDTLMSLTQSDAFQHRRLTNN